MRSWKMLLVAGFFSLATPAYVLADCYQDCHDAAMAIYQEHGFAIAKVWHDGCVYGCQHGD